MKDKPKPRAKDNSARLKAKPDFEKLFDYGELKIRVTYSNRLTEATASCPKCGCSEVANAREDLGMGEALKAAKAKIVTHLRLTHDIYDDEGLRPPAN